MIDMRDRHWIQAQQASAKGRWQEAVALYQEIVAQQPDFVPGWLELSTAYEMLRDYRSALDAVTKASDVNAPMSPMMVAAVGKRLMRFEEAGRCLRYIRASGAINRADPVSLTILASVAASAGGLDDAATWLEQALRAAPLEGRIWALLGNVQTFRGQFVEARQSLLQAIELNPDQSAPYLMLARHEVTGHPRNSPDTLMKLLKRPGLPAGDEAAIAFALHLQLDALGDHDAAWKALQRGCRIKRASLKYDAGRTEALFRRMIECFPEGEVAPSGSRGLDQPDRHPVPIFIVGMFRSGSTLLERILSRHPDVASAGETNLMAASLRYVTGDFGTGTLDDRMLTLALETDRTQLRDRYLGAIAERAGTMRVVIDKTNPNFLLLPWLRDALPHAIVLHTTRNAIDTCFSNLRTLFSHEAAYTYDMRELAAYHQSYHALMAHWRQALPASCLDVPLQDLTADPESQARRILESCGLAASQVLTVEQKDGVAIATASTVRARKSISTDHAGAWKPYEKYLGPLLDGLH